MAAVPTLETAHVLDQSQDWRPKLVEHGDGLLGHVEGEILRRRNDRGAGKGDHLAEAQLDVPCTGRQIDEQVVELAPFHATEELLDHLGEHRAPPDRRLSLWHEEADRHDLDAVAEDGNDLSIPRRGWNVGPHNGWNARPVDISVQQAHPRAQLRERDREICAHGGFADAALSAAHGNDVLDQRDELVFFLRTRGAHLRAHPHLDPLDAGQRANRAVRIFLHLVADGTGRGRQLDGKRDVPAVNSEVFDESERDNVPP